MLTSDEIKQIVDAHKEVFATKQDLTAFQEQMGRNFSGLLTAVDTYGGKADKYFQEMVMLSHQVDRLENGFMRLQRRLVWNSDHNRLAPYPATCRWDTI